MTEVDFLNRNIVFIGAGNLATSLSVAFHSAGWRVVQVYSRTYQSAKTLAGKINAEPTTTLDSLNPNAQLYVVALPDSVIQPVAEQLPPVNGLLVHTSGSTSIDVLSAADALGYGVLYPLQTFSKNRLVQLGNVPVCIEGNSQATIVTLDKIAQTITSTVVVLDSEKRRWMHLAAVFASNFTNHMLAAAYRIAVQNGVDFHIFQPLVMETVSKAFLANPNDFQTGPAVRFDWQTIEQHLSMLGFSDIELQKIYKELSLSIQNFANSKK
jgi:predicted short-subunit dehydrogenase-like oxidoreductase (DUF2520 family)